ncbi:MAG: glycosyltransferase family 39 protein, partial [Deltaproteobacteria bacterium]|nr:glycosyltransferase family 39 protein [Deltaproteobacteria bacterium]
MSGEAMDSVRTTASGGDLPVTPKKDKYASDGGRFHAMAPILALVVLAAAILMQSLGGYSDPDQSGHAWGTDDSYIAYRYALNLAEGEGLVFNPGERVEGYSNLLYVLILAAVAGAHGPDATYPVSAMLNLVLASCAFIAFYVLCRRRLGPSGVTAATWLFALAPAIWAWSAAGLETMLVLALALAVWLEADAVLRDMGRRHLVLLGCAVVLSVLSRADGFLVPLFAAIWLAMRRRWAAAGWAGGVLVVSQGLLTVWRLFYYGWPLPNTYYAKVSGPLADRIVDAGAQLVDLAIHQRLALPLLVLALVAGRCLVRLLSGRESLRAGLQFELVWASGLLAYWFYVGGDVFMERGLVPLFPMAALAGLEYAARFQVKSLVALAATLAALVQLSVVSTDRRFDYVPPSKKYDRWIRLGNFLGG